MISARVKFDRTPVRWPEVSVWTLVVALALAIALLCLPGCSTKTIHVDAIKGPVKKITARHDAYVQADGNLSSTERDTYLLTSELLLKVIEEAEKED